MYGCMWEYTRVSVYFGQRAILFFVVNFSTVRRNTLFHIRFDSYVYLRRLFRLISPLFCIGHRSSYVDVAVTLLLPVHLMQKIVQRAQKLVHQPMNLCDKWWFIQSYFFFRKSQVTATVVDGNVAVRMYLHTSVIWISQNAIAQTNFVVHEPSPHWAHAKLCGVYDTPVQHPHVAFYFAEKKTEQNRIKKWPQL